MEYNFDIELANEYGVNEAIMINYIKLIIFYTRPCERDIFEGRTCVVCNEAFMKMLPFWTTDKIKKILKSLVKQGVLINKNGFYSFVDDKSLKKDGV